MEGLNTLQGKHEEGPFPPLFVTAFIISPCFYLWKSTIYVHKGTSRVFGGGFLELLEDNGPGSPVMYVSITLIQWSSQKWDGKIVDTYIWVWMSFQKTCSSSSTACSERHRCVDVCGTLTAGQTCSWESFSVVRETSSCPSGLCNARLCGLPWDTASFSTVVQGSGLYLFRHLKQVTRCCRLTKALHIASCAI